MTKIDWKGRPGALMSMNFITDTSETNWYGNTHYNDQTGSIDLPAPNTGLLGISWAMRDTVIIGVRFWIKPDGNCAACAST